MIKISNKPYRTVQIGNHLWIKCFQPNNPDDTVVAIRKRGQGELTFDYYDMIVLLESLTNVKQAHQMADALDEPEPEVKND